MERRSGQVRQFGCRDDCSDNCRLGRRRLRHARGGQYHRAEQHYSYRPELHAGLPVQGISGLPYALRAPLGMAGGLSCYWLVTMRMLG